jgi:hypothetical protein
MLLQVFAGSLAGGLGITATLWSHAAFSRGALFATAGLICYWIITIASFFCSQSLYTHFSALQYLQRLKKIELPTKKLEETTLSRVKETPRDKQQQNSVAVTPKEAAFAQMEILHNTEHPSTAILMRFYLGRLGWYVYNLTLLCYAFFAFIMKSADVAGIGHAALIQSRSPSANAEVSPYAVFQHLQPALVSIQNGLDVKEPHAIIVATGMIIAVTTFIPEKIWGRFKYMLDLIMICAHAALVGTLLLGLNPGGESVADVVMSNKAIVPPTAQEQDPTETSLIFPFPTDWSVDCFSAAMFPHNTLPIMFTLFGVRLGTSVQVTLMSFISLYIFVIGVLPMMASQAVGEGSKPYSNFLLHIFAKNPTQWLSLGASPLVVNLFVALPLIHLVAVGRALTQQVALALSRLVTGSDVATAPGLVVRSVLALGVGLAINPAVKIVNPFMFCSTLLHVLFFVAAFRVRNSTSLRFAQKVASVSVLTLVVGSVGWGLTAAFYFARL